MRVMTIKDFNLLLNQQLPSLESDIILSTVLKTSKSFLISHADHVLSYKQTQAVLKKLTERLKNKPIAYITNSKEFYGQDFLVNPSVLIPRPETELLIDLTLETLKQIDHPLIQLLEIGSGSGCIPVSIISNSSKNIQIQSYDISIHALKVAKFNALNLLNKEQNARLKLINRDIFKTKIDYNFSVLVSNPPYISPEEYRSLAANVHDFEPKQALLGGKDGLDFYRLIASIIAKRPLDNQNRFFLLEINSNLEKETVAIFKAWKHEIFKDYAGLARVIKIET